MPKINGEGETARGITDSSGKYKLTSMNGDDGKGALAGDYTVLLWKSETREVNPPRYNKTADVYIKQEAVDIVPVFYAEPDLTLFTFTVEKGKKNVFDIDIDSKTPPPKRKK
ncbi:hypothetical protein FACS189427_08690 [Planctomycetales bacterium]|nr:hypothetical protein FACS189427_08690 [Planctomycetales bacterium]